MQALDKPDNGNIERELAQPVKNDVAESSVASPSQSQEVQRSDLAEPAEGQEPSAVVSRATGPRTDRGKQKASKNATKHGIFSKVIVLKGESRSEYEELLGGIWESRKPGDALEDHLVERLAITAWRQRRVLLAECAEIRKNTEFIEIDQSDRDTKEAERLTCQPDSPKNQGLIGSIHNPKVLERCLEALAQMREGFRQQGGRPGDDETILEKIYGDRDEERLQEDLYGWYLKWLGTFEDSDEEPEHEGNPVVAQSQKKFLEKLDEEILRLQQYQKTETSVARVRMDIEILRQNVPDTPGFDRLLRYDAILERSFDRTLSQLERLQRMRLGQMVLPALKVDVST